MNKNYRDIVQGVVLEADIRAVLREGKNHSEVEDIQFVEDSWFVGLDILEKVGIRVGVDILEEVDILVGVDILEEVDILDWERNLERVDIPVGQGILGMVDILGEVVMDNQMVEDNQEAEKIRAAVESELGDILYLDENPVEQKLKTNLFYFTKNKLYD